MKLDKSKATVVETESTKYFYIYEISCDGVVIPFNPKYLISYLLNDKLLMQSYKGDVYESVKGTWGSLGSGDNTLNFNLTLEVNNIRLSIGELIDAIYNNYNYNSIENVKKLILLAACSKAMLISLLYLIFYNLIDNDELQRLCEFNFNDLYEYTLNRLKENCLTENPLEVNFESYIDDVSYATGKFCEAKDKIIDYEQKMEITVNKDVYKNIVKYSGNSVSYEKSDINDAHKLTQDTTDWLYETDNDAASGKIDDVSRSTDSNGFATVSIKGMPSNGELEFLTLKNFILTNISSHLIIKIPSGTKFKVPYILWMSANLSTAREIYLYPGDSYDIRNAIDNYSGAFGWGSYGEFVNPTVIKVKEYVSYWYNDIADDVRLGRLTMSNEVNTASVPNVPYSADFTTTGSVSAGDLDMITINRRKVKNNTSNMIITIEAGTNITIHEILVGSFDVTVRNKVVLKPGEEKTIEYTDPGEIPWYVYLQWKFLNKSLLHVTFKPNSVFKIKTTNYIPVVSGTTTVSKRATVFLYGNEYNYANNKVTLEGLAKVKSNYKTDLYKINMSVSGFTGATDRSLASVKEQMNDVKNLLSFTPTEGSSDKILFNVQTATNKKISNNEFEKEEVPTLIAADLTDDNALSEVMVVPSNVLISPTENVGLTYRPKLTIKLDNATLLSKANVEKLIDKMIAAETPVKVTDANRDFIIKIEEIKYRPQIDIRFNAPLSSAKDMSDLYTDLQFILNYTDFKLELNGKSYSTDVNIGGKPGLTVETIDSSFVTPVASIEAKTTKTDIFTGLRFGSLDVSAPIMSKLNTLHIDNATNVSTGKQLKAFNKDMYNKFAASRPKSVNLLNLRFTCADVLATIDVSSYNIYLYNGNFYRGSDMGD